jgi:hypothetical protein
MPRSADKRVDDVTRAILYPWVRDALQLIHEAQRQAKVQLAWIERGTKDRALGPHIPLMRERIANFIERCDKVLKESSGE